MAQYKQDAIRIAKIYRDSGVEAATAAFHAAIENLPYWATLALKDEIRNLVAA